MEKFIPLGKMSKKKQREIHRLSRKDWGGISPVTRKEKNPKAYNRAAEKRKGASRKNWEASYFYFADKALFPMSVL
ncbi:MAG: hypothetical protein J1F11_00270 [Oscillospiraceae bacterium]|nr:hypothetical protein [Oscillospiraceae bacterium]